MSGLTCEQAERWLAAFIDDELDVDERERVQSHLDECPSCTTQHRAEASVRDLVRNRKAHLKLEAPAGLKRRILQAVRSEQAGRGRIPRLGRRPLWAFAAAACLALAVVAGGALYLNQEDSPDAVVASMVNEHIRCLMKLDGGLDVVASDPAEVGRWFRGRLAAGVLPPSFENTEMRLQGGRICSILGRYGAQLVYQRGDHLVCMFIMEPNGAALPEGEERAIAGRPARFTVLKGYSVVIWENRGLLQALVADVGDQELMALAESSVKS